jgi:sulfur-carrier protein adenylyltransferase/sulfurtransferase
VSDAVTPELNEWEIEPRQVSAMLDSGDDFLLIDCRTPDEHDLGVIKGAMLAPMQDLDLHLPKLRGREDDLIIVYCRSGKRSMTVTTVLREQGFRNVKSMAGGILRWSDEIDPTLPKC